MRRPEENQPAVYPLTRSHRAALLTTIEDTQLVWPHRPHPMQCQALGMLIWQYDGEYEIQATQSMLIQIMGILMQQASREDHQPFRQNLLYYHQALSNVFSLFQNMRAAPALYTAPC